MQVDIVQIDPGEAAGLIRELDDYQAELYPAESNHLDSLDTLRADNVVMLAVKENASILAIGAVKFMAGYGEIKRVYVPGEHRGRGLARQIMAALEARLKAEGISEARLETGIRQPEAIGLYRALGYETCGPFGGYRPDPLSLFMVKYLD